MRQDKRDAERPVVRILADGRSRPVEPVEIALAHMPEVQEPGSTYHSEDLQRALEVQRNPGNEARLTREQGASGLAGH